MTLKAGMIIVMRTPAGDEVICEIEKIGILKRLVY